MRTIALLFSASLLLCCAADPNGRWEGTLDIPGMELPIVVDLAAAGGAWTGSAILPGLDIKGVGLADLQVKDSAVTFKLKGAFGDPQFDGRLTAAGDLEGHFTQAGNTAPFKLHRTGPPQVEPPRPSTPVSKEVEGEWLGDFDLGGNPLHARLTLKNQGSSTTAQFAIGNKKGTDLPVNFVTQDGEWLTVEAREYGMSFEGRIHAGGDEIRGVFMQSGLEFPLVLHRAAKP